MSEPTGNPLAAAAPAPLGSADMRRANLSLVLRSVLDRPRSKAQIATDVRLTKGAVGGLVAELADRGLVRVGSEPVVGPVGRPGFLVQAVPERVHAVGLSLSVVYLIGTVVDLDGRVLLQEQLPLDWGDTPADVLVDRAVDLARALGAEARALLPGSVPAGVAIGVPDLVDATLGVVRRSPTTGLRDHPLRAVVEARLGPGAGPVQIDNDANFGALAEWRSRARSAQRNLLYVTGSYGVGGGIIAAGRVHRGAGGFAGEVGHLVVNPGGVRCSCGGSGCLEAEIGLARFLAEVGHLDPRLQDRRIPVDEHVSTVLAAALAGDARTLAAVDEVARLLGAGLSSLVAVLNPDTIVLGGYFARLLPLLLPPLRRALQERVMPELLEGCSIEASHAVTHAAALGGARSVLDRILERPDAVPRAASPVRLDAAS